MPRVVPSQVVGVIDQLFPWAASQTEEKNIALRAGDQTRLAPILDLTQQIPDELIVLDNRKYSEFVSSIAAIRTAIATWTARGETLSLDRLPGFRKLNPVTLIRQALAACPDEFPSIGTAELNFVQDTRLRENLRLDISATNRALSNSEWKAATVLAGSVIEALLLWVLEQQSPKDLQNTVTQLLNSGTLKSKPDNDIKTWGLFLYIEVAAALKVIPKDATKQARLAKDYRNLIHPGLAERLGQTCDRGTALTAIAALEHVVRALTP